MDNSTNNKPDWLIKLEQESWQAELVISGLAIFGSLQLPELIVRFGEWAFTYFTMGMGLFLYALVIYLLFASCGFIISFIIHFILRAIWIGLIGINSVFPKGINTTSESYSPYFLKQLKENYSIENSGVKALDQFCSGIFAMNVYGTLSIFSSILLMLFLYGINSLLNLFLPTNVQLIIFIIFITLLFGASIFSYFANSKKYSTNIKFQEISYIIYSYYGLVVFNVLRRPIIYLQSLIGSNIEKKQFNFRSLLGLIPTCLLAFYYFLNSHATFLIDPEIALIDYARTDKTHLEHYEENLETHNLPIYSTLIPSQKIQGELLKVFIPIFSNEASVYEELCGTFETESFFKSSKERLAKRQFDLDCYNKYHKISVNDESVTNELIIHKHPHRNTFGVLTYLPTDNFKKGKNLLKVEKLTKDSIYRTMVVPFWFSQE